MRLRRISLRGLVRFTGPQPVVVDFDELGSGLIALEGENGEGKTTFMEAVPAALYKELPSREAWYEYWHGRDAFVEVVFDDGGRDIKVRVQVDADRRTTERYLFEDGRSITTGRAREADAEILRRFGSYELFLASVLGSQKRTGNFLDAAKGERKARFIELLGLGALDVMHKGARERRVQAEAELDAARAALEELEELQELRSLREEEVETARAEQERAAGALATAREEEAAATSALERARTSGERIAALRSARDSARATLAGADQGLKDAIAAGMKARQEATRRRESNASQADDVAAQERRANERHAGDVEALDARRARLEAALEERPDLVAARDQVGTLEAEAASLEAAEKGLRDAQAEKTRAGEALAATTRRLGDAEVHLRREVARLDEEAQLLDRVPCTATARWLDPEHHPDGWVEESTVVDLAGTCPLLKAAQEAKARGPQLKIDPATVEAAHVAKERFDAYVEAEETATLVCDPARMVDIRRELTVARTKAARLGMLDQAAADLKGLAGELARLNEAKSKELKVAAERRERLAADASEIETDLQKALAEALGRETTARARAADAREACLTAEKAFEAAGAGDVSIPQAEAGLSTARQNRIDAERVLREADKVHATAAATLADLMKRLEALPAAREAATAAERQVGALRLLEQALGKDGVQALEIAAAGPEVARLTNELLGAYEGARWTIAFETQEEKKSDRGVMKETFSIRAFDHGEERTVEGISGGERVIVGEAVALALAVYNARKSGIQWRTLFRDETSGSLSLGNATKYADMLRRALTLGGFHQVLFISHQPEVVERADVRLLVADGRVVVAGAPVREVAHATA